MTKLQNFTEQHIKDMYIEIYIPACWMRRLKIVKMSN